MAQLQLYRSVKLILQNSTNDNFNVQGFAVASGVWAEKMAPVQGMLVAEQSAADWTSISTVLGVGTAAYIRFGSSFGFFAIRWKLPWAGRFEHHLESVPGVRLDSIVDSSHPDSIVMLITVLTERME